MNDNVSATAADLLCKTLNLEKISVIKGGPSIQDPLGLIATYVGFRDKANQGFWFALNEIGVIVKFGATLDHKSYEFPVPVKVDQL